MSIHSFIKVTVAAFFFTFSAAAAASAAPDNGHGIVYNKSDCSPGNMRFYGNGGAWSGSTCERWLSGAEADCIGAGSGTEHNWNTDELYAIYSWNHTNGKGTGAENDSNLMSSLRAVCGRMNDAGEDSNVQDWARSNYAIVEEMAGLLQNLIDLIINILEI